MGNGIVTTFCAAAICCAIQGGYVVWMWAFLMCAMVIAVYNNIQWAKVFKAAAVVIAAKNGRGAS